MHNVLIISYIAFSIGNLFILPESHSKLPNIRNVSGKIRVNDGIDKALHILQYTADFSYKKNSETNVVTIY